MTDKILAFLSMLLLAAFLSIVVIYVNEPDLWIVVVVVLLMGIYDFVKSCRAKRSD